MRIEELRRVFADQQRLIVELQVALRSMEGEKVAEGSTHELEDDVPSIEFESAGGLTAPHEYADPYPIKRRVMERVFKGPHLPCSPFVPLPSSTLAFKKNG